MADSQIEEQVRRRRTFAIISHPDAGKTTLTEKLLLFSGAIQIAGSVKARKASRHATSDWMEIEKQRGISVASSVMQMEYRDCVINLLDTPGHQDFSEDTYRVLTAVDAALMVIDAANGVEPQTRRLLQVCRARNTPILTFVNKMDREVQDPMSVMDEIEQELGMTVVPFTWPVGMGKLFHGVYDRREDRMRVLSIEAFRAWYLNRTTEMTANDGKIKCVTWATAWLGSYDRRQYSGLEFAPMGSAGADPAPTPGYYNLWRGFSVVPAPASVARNPGAALARAETRRESGAVGSNSPSTVAAPASYDIFRDHMLTNVCAGNADLFSWVFGWFAHIIQRPRERVGTALVLRGCMGSGKTKVGEVFGSLIAAHYFMVDDPRYVTGQFNAHMASCLLLQAEEAVWAGDKAAEGRLNAGKLARGIRARNAIRASTRSASTISCG